MVKGSGKIIVSLLTFGITAFSHSFISTSSSGNLCIYCVYLQMQTDFIP